MMALKPIGLAQACIGKGVSLLSVFALPGLYWSFPAAELCSRI